MAKAPPNARYLVDALNPYRDGSETMPVQVEQVSDGSLLEQICDGSIAFFFPTSPSSPPAKRTVWPTSFAVAVGWSSFLAIGSTRRSITSNSAAAAPAGRAFCRRCLSDSPKLGTYGFDPLEYSDPLVHEFAGNVSAGLLTTIVNRYFRLKSPTPSACRPSVPSTGDPAIVAAPITGDASLPLAAGSEPAASSSPRPSPLAPRPYSPGGRSILVTLPVSFASLDPATKQPWSNWPLKASFQPMMQNLLRAAIGPQGADRNVQVGQPLESSLSTVADPPALCCKIPTATRNKFASRPAANQAAGFFPTHGKAASIAPKCRRQQAKPTLCGQHRPRRNALKKIDPPRCRSN